MGTGQSADKMNRKVILGLGNLLRTDDGLGVHAIRALAGKTGDWELIDGGTLGLTLLPYLEGVWDLLILDAIRLGEPAGTLHRFALREFTRMGRDPAISGHDLGLLELWNGLQLKESLPLHCEVLGLEPESLEWGTELSGGVQNALPLLLDQVLEFVTFPRVVAL
jgi:hydrogenase maturation protease